MQQNEFLLTKSDVVHETIFALISYQSLIVLNEEKPKKTHTHSIHII